MEAPPERAAELNAAAAERAAAKQQTGPLIGLVGATQWFSGVHTDLAETLEVATQPPAEQLALEEDAPVPSADTLSRRLDTVFGGLDFSTTALVTDAMTGEVLYSRGAEQQRVPASSLKILTAAAALTELGSEHQYVTRTVLDETETADEAADADESGGAQELRVALVAGGDSLLGTGGNAETVDGRAGLGALAQQSVDALAKQVNDGAEGSEDISVSVVVDDSGYSGPAVSEDWAEAMVETGNISAVQPMALYGARSKPGTGTERVDDPVLHAGKAFRDELAAVAEESSAGFTVTDEVSRDSGPEGDAVGQRPGEELGAVHSATVSEQVEYFLTHSDNQVAEVTARNAAAASGRPASFDGVAQLLTATAESLGIDAEGSTVVDGSGLSANNRLTATQLVAMLDAVQSRPWLADAVWGLPTAGLEGTLAERMVNSSAAGLVRAKTGTLKNHSSLTGTVVTVDGRQLWFSVLNSGLDGALNSARTVQDTAAGVLADCGC